MLKRIRSLRSTATSLALALLAAPFALADGGSAVAPPTRIELSPQQEAEELYNGALRARDKAWKLEEKAMASADAAAQERLQGKVQKQFHKAISQLRRAIELAPTLYQAHSSLGYALRRTGDHAAALVAYNQALALAPTYAEAIEYRAEAYLGLNRIDDAKRAYMLLFNSDRQRADKLLAAMDAWLTDRAEKAPTAQDSRLEPLAEWVEERRQIAQQTARHSGGPQGTWK